MSHTARGPSEGPPVTYVDDAAALRDVCEHLHGVERFGLDTEFVGERTYVPQLEVVQVATAERAALIDCRAVDVARSLLRRAARPPRREDRSRRAAGPRALRGADGGVPEPGAGHPGGSGDGRTRRAAGVRAAGRATDRRDGREERDADGLVAPPVDASADRLRGRRRALSAGAARAAARSPERARTLAVVSRGVPAPGGQHPQHRGRAGRSLSAGSRTRLTACQGARRPARARRLARGARSPARQAALQCRARRGAGRDRPQGADDGRPACAACAPCARASSIATRRTSSRASAALCRRRRRDGRSRRPRRGRRRSPVWSSFCRPCCACAPRRRPSLPTCWLRTRSCSCSCSDTRAEKQRSCPSCTDGGGRSPERICSPCSRGGRRSRSTRRAAGCACASNRAAEAGGWHRTGRGVHVDPAHDTRRNLRLRSGALAALLSRSARLPMAFGAARAGRAVGHAAAAARRRSARGLPGARRHSHRAVALRLAQGAGDGRAARR